jgi:hypothetical protein
MQPESNNYFTVTPMSQRVSLKPGEVYNGSITIINPVNSESDFNYKATVTPYSVVGEDYAADLATKSNYNMMTDWVKIEEPTGTLKPNNSKEIKFSIKVPENAPAGGQYATIAISQDQSTDAKDGGVAVNNVFEMASLIYAEVAGETKHETEIIENQIPGFVTSAPITLKALLKNEGNVHETATIVIEAKDFFTGNVIVETENDANRYTELVMPETTRAVERNINENLPALGVVHIEQTIYYNGEQSVTTRDVIICPVWFMILLGVTITAIVGTIVMIVRKHHKKKKLLSID